MSKIQQYVCVMFPYPSGDGLHIGHVYNYAIIDSYCRYLRMNENYDVFQPFGYDAFGLPAENYAKKVGRDPRDVTYENIEKFRVQMQHMNTEFEEKLITSDPSYQKWTQWLFLKLKEHDLAYKAMGNVNWCPSCETVLAREQVKDACCERCSSLVEMKELEQWYFRITKYTERLLANLNKIDYPESTINAQRNWLLNQHDWCVSRQRPWGCPIPIEGETDTLDTFVDSSFYYVRYCDSDNENELCAPDKYKQVDLYVGGSEHATMHLIYTRFIHMFLYDIGVVPVESPFKKVIHQGMILNNGEKMSKTKGNVISPDSYDPDELRFYLMFIGPYTDGGSWSDQHLTGVQRFIARMKRWVEQPNAEGDYVIAPDELSKFMDQVFLDTDNFRFNKVVSGFMSFYNKHKKTQLDYLSKLIIMNILEIYMPGIKEKIQIPKNERKNSKIT